MDALASGDSGTFWLQSTKTEKAAGDAASENTDNNAVNGGADWTRTLALQRDRAKFFVPDLA